MFDYGSIPLPMLLASTVAIGALASVCFLTLDMYVLKKLFKPWAERKASDLVVPYRKRYRRYTIQPSGTHGFDVWYREWDDTDEEARSYLGHFHDEQSAEEAILKDIELNAKYQSDKAIQETRMKIKKPKEWPSEATVQYLTDKHFDNRLRSHHLKENAENVESEEDTK